MSSEPAENYCLGLATLYELSVANVQMMWKSKKESLTTTYPSIGYLSKAFLLFSYLYFYMMYIVIHRIMKGEAVFVDSLYRLRSTQSKLFPQYHTMKIHNIFTLSWIPLLPKAYNRWVRICKRLHFRNRSPGVETIRPAYVAWRAGMLNRVVVSARQDWNRFLGSIIKGLWCHIWHFW